jgi:hypothetical protein
MGFEPTFELPDFDISSLEGLANTFFYGAGMLGTVTGGSGGAVMGKLGMYPFFMHHNTFKQLTKTINAEFSRYKPIKGQVVLGDSGGFSETLNLNGILVAEPVHTTKPLEWYAKMRKPLRFTTLVHDEKIVITTLTKTESHFSILGRHRVQSYDLQMEVVYGSIV